VELTSIIFYLAGNKEYAVNPAWCGIMPLERVAAMPSGLLISAFACGFLDDMACTA